MKGQGIKLFWKEKIHEICFQTRFKYAMETTFRYSAYHLILHWNHYLCSSALSHLLATVSPLTFLGTSSRFMCSWSYPFLSLFWRWWLHYYGHVWMEVLVLICSKLTPKLTLLNQTNVSVWRTPPLFSLSLSFLKCLEKWIQMQTNTSIQTSKMLVFYVLIWRC
jgi:hypothetical protein